jgi:hypothetical protein
MRISFQKNKRDIMQFKRESGHVSRLKKKHIEKQLPAEEIAAMALQYMADDAELLSRFFALTGLAPDDLRDASNQPEFLVAVLDFFLGFEPNLLKFAEINNLDPESVVTARATLALDETQHD